jgi:MFS family permease
MGTFIAAAIIPAYENIALDLSVSIQEVSYLTSLQIACFGVGPLFWQPLSQRFGRRPIFLVSLVLSFVCNIGCAKSPDYASMAACRALVALFICPAMALGSAVVAETFFKRERAKYMGIWTVMVTLGVPIGPFIFGFVAQRVGYRWIYWILAIVRCIHLPGHHLLTSHDRPTPSNSSCTSSSAPKPGTSAQTTPKNQPSRENTFLSAASTLPHLRCANSTTP